MLQQNLKQYEAAYGNDNESQDVYFDSGQRSFYVSRPLQFGMDDEHCFQLRFYSPRALKNVTFWARIDGYEEEFKFMSLEKIMPFQQLRVHIPFATKDLTAYTRSGKKIRIMANPYLTEENLTFTVECDDPYWTRLQSIRCFLRKMRDLRTPPRSSMWQDLVTLSAMDTHITEP